MTEQEVILSKCQMAIDRALERIRRDDATHRVMGPCSETYRLLVQAKAAYTGRELWEIENETEEWVCTPEEAAIDMQPFCAWENDAPDELKQPSSTEHDSWASDRAILIRLPRRKDATGVARWTMEHVLHDPEAIAKREGYYCLATPLPREARVVRIGDRAFGADYIRKMLALPALRVSLTGGSMRPLFFRFGKNGAGVLMPLRVSSEDQAEWSLIPDNPEIQRPALTPWKETR